MLTAKVVVYENGLTVYSAIVKFKYESALLYQVLLPYPTYTEVEHYSSVDLENVVGHACYICSDGSDSNFVTVSFFFPIDAITVKE